MTVFHAVLEFGHLLGCLILGCLQLVLLGEARFEIRGPFGSDLAAQVANLAREQGWNLTELHEARYTLEDTFIALTRRSQEVV